MIDLLDVKHLTPGTAEKGDSQGKIISFGLRGIPKNMEISFGKKLLNNLFKFFKVNPL